MPDNSLSSRILRIETILHIICRHLKIDPKESSKDSLKIKLAGEGCNYTVTSSGFNLPIDKILHNINALEKTSEVPTTRPIVKLVHNGKEIGHLMISTLA